MTVQTRDLVAELKGICQVFIEHLVDEGHLNSTFRKGIAIRVYRADEAPPVEDYEIPYRVEVTETDDEWEKRIEANEEATRERGYAQSPKPPQRRCQALKHNKPDHPAEVVVSAPDGLQWFSCKAHVPSKCTSEDLAEWDFARDLARAVKP